MKDLHPIRKKNTPIPHDPRNEPLPEGDQPDRPKEGAEKDARIEEGVGLKGADHKLPTGKPARDERGEQRVTEDEYGLPTGIRTGPTTPAPHSGTTRKESRPDGPKL